MKPFAHEMFKFKFNSSKAFSLENLIQQIYLDFIAQKALSMFKKYVKKKGDN